MDDLPGQTHLHRIGDRYYFRARVPLDLIQAYGGKKEFKKALGTSDRAEALIRLHQEAADFLSKNEMLRLGASGMETEVSDQRLLELAFELLTERQRLSETNRLRAPLRREEQEIVLENLGTEEGYESDLHSRADYMGDGSSHIVRDASRLLEKHRIALRPGGERFLQLCEFISRANLEHLAREQARLQGYASPTRPDALFRDRPLPSTPAPTQSLTSPSVKEAAEQFWRELKETAPLRDKTRQKYRAALDLVIEFLGPSAKVADIHRDQCKGFLNLLTRLPPNNSKSARNKPVAHLIADAMASSSELAGEAPANRLKFDSRKAYFRQLEEFLRWAAAEGKAPTIDWTNLQLKRLADDVVGEEDDERRHRAFAEDELAAVFRTPLYTGCRDAGRGFNTVGNLVPRDTARFWLPLLGLWTGARLGELCQLRPIDVSETKKGIPFIRITDEGEFMTLKTKNARREVPLHPELIKLGFLQFVEACRKRGDPSLFPDMLIKGRATSYQASKQFGSFLEATKLKRPKLCYHSFRHTFRKALRRARVSEELVVKILGWSRGTMSDHYAQGEVTDTLYEDVCKVTHPDLDLSSLHVP